MSAGFEPLGEEVCWEGKLVRVGIAHYRHADGTEVAREKVWHSGAVGVLALDEETVWLVRQPREVVGEQTSLEIPAGKLDVPGEPPLGTAQRELAEEIGQRAARWSELFSFRSSPGFTDERIWLYLAQDLSPAPPAEVEEDERIEVVCWPLDRLSQAIEECRDAKSLVALLWLAARTGAEVPRASAG